MGRVPARAAGWQRRVHRVGQASRDAAACRSSAGARARPPRPHRSRGSLRQPQGHELGQQLVQVAAEGRLLGDLAQGGDGNGVAHVPPARDRATLVVEHEPGARPAPSSKAQRYVRRPGVASAASTAVTEAPSGAVVAAIPAMRSRSASSDTAPGYEKHGRVDTVSARQTHAARCSRRSPGSYDRVGAVLSLGQDPRWRRALVARVPNDGGSVLDVATGTGLVASCCSPAVIASPGSTRAPTCSRRRGGASATASRSSRARRPSSPFPTPPSTISRSRTSCATSTIPGRRCTSSRASSAEAARSPRSSSASRAGSGGGSGTSTSASASRSPAGSSRPAGTRSAGSSAPRSAASTRSGRSNGSSSCGTQPGSTDVGRGG